MDTKVTDNANLSHILLLLSFKGEFNKQLLKLFIAVVNDELLKCILLQNKIKT